MATISSHLLNGTEGSHAGGIAVRMANCDTGELVFESSTDAAGRLSQQVPPEQIDPAAIYELVFDTGPYWSSRSYPGPGTRAIEQVAVRLSMPDPCARYHIPVIISPNSYSVWWSQPE